MAAQVNKLGSRLPSVIVERVFEYVQETNMLKVSKVWHECSKRRLPYLLKQNWNTLCQHAGLLAPFVKPADSDHLERFKELKGALKDKLPPDHFKWAFDRVSHSFSGINYLRFEICLNNSNQFVEIWDKRGEDSQQYLLRHTHSLLGLDLSGIPRKTLPNLLFKLEHMVVLDLSNNDLSSPLTANGLSSLKKLQYLNLKGNPIHKTVQLRFKQELPEMAPQMRLCEMDDYEYTTLSTNNLKKIWHELVVQLNIQNRSMCDMFLWFGDESDIPDYVLACQELKLSKAELTCLPEELFRFKNITVLDLSGTSFPDKEKQIALKRITEAFPKLETLFMGKDTFQRGAHCVIC